MVRFIKYSCDNSTCCSSNKYFIFQSKAKDHELSVAQKASEIRQLKLALRERDNDIQRANDMLLTTEETIDVRKRLPLIIDFTAVINQYKFKAESMRRGPQNDYTWCLPYDEIKTITLDVGLVLRVNPCPAGPGYIRFEESFNRKKTPLKLIKYSVVDAQLIKYFNLGDVYFFMNRNIFRHLKLEIALAIPASNDEKYNWNNSAGRGLRPGGGLFVCHKVTVFFKSWNSKSKFNIGQ